LAYIARRGRPRSTARSVAANGRKPLYLQGFPALDRVRPRVTKRQGSVVVEQRVARIVEAGLTLDVRTRRHQDRVRETARPAELALSLGDEHGRVGFGGAQGGRQPRRAPADHDDVEVGIGHRASFAYHPSAYMS